MPQSPGWWRALIASAIIVCLAFAVSASGQSGKSGGFATVDVQKVTDGYKAMQLVQTDLKARQASSQAKLARRDSMPFLTEEEQQELDKLTDKPPASRSAADSARIKELTDKGARLGAEIDALRQKPDKDLSDADRQRIKDAAAAFDKAKQAFAALKETEDNALREFAVSNQEALMKNFRSAVGKVATDKGISIVFDGQVALYAGTDLTAAVLAELNKK